MREGAYIVGISLEVGAREWVNSWGGGRMALW